MTNRKPAIHDPARQPGTQATTRAKRQTYKGMTSAEIIRGMSDMDLSRAAKRCGGSELAIYEQAWRHNNSENMHRDEISEFEAALLIEAETPEESNVPRI